MANTISSIIASESSEYQEWFRTGAMKSGLGLATTTGGLSLARAVQLVQLGLRCDNMGLEPIDYIKSALKYSNNKLAWNPYVEYRQLKF